MKYHNNHQFKHGLANFYGNCCIISGFHTNQKNHIIPRSFAIHFQKYQYLATDCNNGTCLTPTLHSEYDNYYWDFDVYRAKLNDDGITCQVPIIISTLSKVASRRLMIMQYSNRWVNINVNTIPYMWVHYQVFLSVNYHQVSNPNLEYNFWLESQYFQELCQKPLQILHQVGTNQREFIKQYDRDISHESLIIIKVRDFGSEYLVISRNYPFNQQVWFKNTELDIDIINYYQSIYTL
jgi:hypothetical protein